MAEIVTMPKLGFDMAEGTLVRWVKSEGDSVNKGDILAEIETDKATVEVESNFEGLVFKHLVNQEEVVPIGVPIAVIKNPDEEDPDLRQLLKDVETAEEKESGSSQETTSEPTSISSPEKTQTEQDIQPDSGRVKASPLARRMAEEHDLILSSVEGSGPWWTRG